MGDENGGKSGLKKVRDFFKKHPSLQNQPFLLLYDWDAGKTEETDEKIWVRSIPPNPDDTDNKAGIENLFSHHLFEERFYEEEAKKGVHGRKEVETKFKKKEFCQWICEERRNPADFEKFKAVIDILQQFFDGTQTPVIQQPPSE